MAYNPLIHNRNSIRLQGYDYSSEGSFITICTHHKQHLFGKIIDENMYLNTFGEIVRDEWEKSAIIRSEIELGVFVVMPNHFHSIVFIRDTNDDRRGVWPNLLPPNDQNAFSGLRPKSVGSLITGFKSAGTKQMNSVRNISGRPVWQRNYWDHIIRNDEEFEQIEDYIKNNPTRWQQDQLN